MSRVKSLLELVFKRLMRPTSGLSPFLKRVRPHPCSYPRLFATVSSIPQTIIEKVVQKYAVDLPDGKVVKAGDYVMIRPEHVMTHDNTGPVISKYVSPSSRPPLLLTLHLSIPGSSPSALQRSQTLSNLSSPSTMMSRTNPRKTLQNTLPSSRLLATMVSTFSPQVVALDTRSSSRRDMHFPIPLLLPATVTATCMAVSLASALQSSVQTQLHSGQPERLGGRSLKWSTWSSKAN